MLLLLLVVKVLKQQSVLPQKDLALLEYRLGLAGVVEGGQLVLVGGVALLVEVDVLEEVVKLFLGFERIH